MSRQTTKTPLPNKQGSQAEPLSPTRYGLRLLGMLSTVVIHIDLEIVSMSFLESKSVPRELAATSTEACYVNGRPTSEQSLTTERVPNFGVMSSDSRIRHPISSKLSEAGYIPD